MDCLTIRSWEIETKTDSIESKDYKESIFSQGNGYMGVRGYSPEASKKNEAERSTFFSGFFEYIRPGITDMVNQPDYSATKILLNGQDVSAMEKTVYSQTLNMRDGTLCWRYTITDLENRITNVEIIRFLSMKDIHTAAIRFVITPVNYDGSLYLETGIDGNVFNLPISDNQLSQNLELMRMWSEACIHTNGRDGGLSVETRQSKRMTAMEYRILVKGISEDGVKALSKQDFVSTIVDTQMKQSNTYIIDKLIAVSSYRDCADPKEQAVTSINACMKLGFDGMLKETKEAWEEIWNTSDVELEASEELQGAVRYNIYQLIQSDPASDPYASIGARGLMHGRYKGCYFWDTEIFMLPFFLNTNPEAAKNLLLYRYHTLKDATESAKGFSMKGARYSWMSSDTGYEQCETWDTGCCEIHITADIAYAMGRYVEQTKDIAFLRDYAAEVYVQTARYWADRFSYDKAADCYNLLFVKGPDEYCGVTVNNFYTVKLALHNLKLACDAVINMKKDFPVEWQLLKDRILYQTEEAEEWNNIIQKAVTYYDKEQNLWIQDATFEQLEPLDTSEHKEDDVPLYHKFSFDRLQRYQVLKQPDVLMLMALLPEEYPEDQKRIAWDYYEPKTLHDSTLSFGIHAMFAARLGLYEAADKYFYKSVFLDLKNIMKNTAREGIHTAALGATWQALIFGYAGLWIGSKGITCNPNLPKSINKMKFRISYQDNRYEVTVEQGKSPSIIFLHSI